MDYRRFLGANETRVLPHFGGGFVFATDRRLRLSSPVEPGWWRFEIVGRNAAMIEAAEPDTDALASLPGTRGHFLSFEMVREGPIAEPLHFLPADQPARFAPLRAKRWPSGQLIFLSVDFETEAEDAARRAFEEGRPLGAERGIPATLRAAFGYAIARVVGARLHVAVSFAEIAGLVADIADKEDGRAVAETALRRLAEQRAEEERRRAGLRFVDEARRAAAGVSRPRDHDEAEDRAERALSKAGAELVDARRLDGGLIEVTYRFQGERFISLVERAGLRVVDAGICLAGHDDRVTLESLPAVIRESMAAGRLVITRRDANDPIGRYGWEREYVDDEEV